MSNHHDKTKKNPDNEYVKDYDDVSEMAERYYQAAKDREWNDNYAVDEQKEAIRRQTHEMAFHQSAGISTAANSFTNPLSLTCDEIQAIQTIRMLAVKYMHLCIKADNDDENAAGKADECLVAAKALIAVYPAAGKRFF